MMATPHSNGDSQQTSYAKIIAGKAFAEAMRNPQHDAHVRAFNTFRRAYGSAEGYHLAMAEHARITAKMMRTPQGRATIARRNADHAAWRASRAGLPF